MEIFALSTAVLFVLNIIQYIANKTNLEELKSLREKQETLIRTKDDKGRFVADNSNTPQNEAYKKVSVAEVRKVVETNKANPQKNTRRGRKPKANSTK